MMKQLDTYKHLGNICSDILRGTEQTFNFKQHLKNMTFGKIPAHTNILLFGQRFLPSHGHECRDGHSGWLSSTAAVRCQLRHSVFIT